MVVKVVVYLLQFRAYVVHFSELINMSIFDRHYIIFYHRREASISHYNINLHLFLPESLQIAADFGEVSGRQIGICPKDVDEQLVLGRGVQLIELVRVGLG